MPLRPTKNALRFPADSPYQSIVGLIGWFLGPAAIAAYAITLLQNGQIPGIVNTIYAYGLGQFLITVVVFQLFVSTTHHRISTLIFSVGLAALVCYVSITHHVQFAADSNPTDNSPVQALALSLIAGAITVFIAMPFFRTAMIEKRTLTHYPSLFRFAWSHSIVLLVGLLFAAMASLLFGVGNTLLGMLNSPVALVWSSHVQIPIQAVGFALGVAIARKHGTIVSTLGNLVLSLVKALMPVYFLILLVFVAVYFTDYTPSQSLANDSENDRMGVLVLWPLCVALGLLFCTAAVGPFKKGRTPAWLNWSWRLMALLLLVMTCYIAYTTWVQLSQNGITLVLQISAITSAILLFYAIGYAISASFTRIGNRGVQQTNVFGAIITALCFLFIQTPIVDLVTLPEQNQVSRMKTDGHQIDVNHTLRKHAQAG